MSKSFTRVGRVWGSIGLVVCLLALWAAAGATQWLGGRMLAAWISGKTGYPCRIGALRLQPLRGRVEVRDIVVMHPADLPRGETLRLTRLLLDVDGRSLLTGGELRVRRLELDAAQVVIAQTTDGRSNLTPVFAARRPSRPGPEQEDATKDAEPEGRRRIARETRAAPRERVPSGPGSRTTAGPRGYHIDEFTFRLGSVEMHMYYDEDGPPQVQRLELEAEKTHRDVKDLAAAAQQMALAIAADLLLQF